MLNFWENGSANNDIRHSRVGGMCRACRAVVPLLFAAALDIYVFPPNDSLLLRMRRFCGRPAHL